MKDPIDALMGPQDGGPGVEEEDEEDEATAPEEVEVPGPEEVALPEEPKLPERPAQEVMDDLQSNLDELRSAMSAI